MFGTMESLIDVWKALYEGALRERDEARATAEDLQVENDALREQRDHYRRSRGEWMDVCSMEATAKGQARETAEQLSEELDKALTSAMANMEAKRFWEGVAARAQCDAERLRRQLAEANTKVVPVGLQADLVKRVDHLEAEQGLEKLVTDTLEDRVKALEDCKLLHSITDKMVDWCADIEGRISAEVAISVAHEQRLSELEDTVAFLMDVVHVFKGVPTPPAWVASLPDLKAAQGPFRSAMSPIGFPPNGQNQIAQSLSELAQQSYDTTFQR